ncbi:MAG: hypothetical protein II343_04210 [Clostridia bacterium]|nr:hypothetical protein [Clostridia bacterium]
MRNVLKAAFITLLAYLLQVCAMPYLKIGGVIGNLSAVCIAILTVSLGKKYTFGASCVTGILMDVMTSSIAGLYAVIWPVVSMVFAMVFADMSDERREIRRNRNKDSRDMNPHIRIPLNAMCICLALEVILLTYTTLSGTQLTMRHISRVLLSVVYTGAMAVVIMWPVRLWLHMYGGRVERAVTYGENDEEV